MVASLQVSFLIFFLFWLIDFNYAFFWIIAAGWRFRQTLVQWQTLPHGRGAGFFQILSGSSPSCRCKEQKDFGKSRCRSHSTGILRGSVPRRNNSTDCFSSFLDWSFIFSLLPVAAKDQYIASQPFKPMVSFIFSEVTSKLVRTISKNCLLVRKVNNNVI